MPTIVVNTAADTIASDGVTSLREAVAMAAGMSGRVDIVFDIGTFYNIGTNTVTAIQLQQTLVIAANVTIDGSLLYPGAFYSVKITADSLPTNAVTVEAGANVTLRDLTIQGNSVSTIKALYGTDGHNGAHGVNGVGAPNNGPFVPSPTTGTDGTSGTHATDGSDAPNDAGNGKIAVGGIVNRGTLTLERVDVRNFRVEGGAGGLGGEGGQGGAGGNGEAGSQDMSHPSGGNGGNGGHSGDGARGGDGGAAAAGIYNVGTLTLRDTVLSGMISKGGNGGQGGDGVRGGHGGQWGLSLYDTVAKGGNGGNGSDGGNGGSGGSASALFNAGTLIIEGMQAAVQAGSYTGGLGGMGGDFGDLGVRGGMPSSSWQTAQDGLDGLPGVKGSKGGNGSGADFLGASVQTGASFTIAAAKEVISEQSDANGRLVYFNVRLLGGSSSVTESVKWEIVPGKGFTYADFELATVTSGTLTFEGSTTDYLFGYRVAADGKAEGLESFTVKLSNPNGGVLGWSKSVTVYITDGDLEGKAPTKLTLSDTSLKENSKNNAKLGDLSTKDGDKGDQFTYELINDAGGRYKVVGNTIKVANATLLDYEQAKSHKIVVRSTDLFGNSIDKTFKINVENVTPEKIKGDAFANKLYGGTGKDTIFGGGGNDTLKGGGDADRFVFDTTLNAATNVDQIKDFKHDVDKIALDKDIFKGLGNKLKAGAFVTDDVAHDKGDRILYDKGKLYYDADGNKPGADPILFAVLDKKPALDAGDFIIV